MIDAEKSFLMHNMNPSDEFRRAQAFRRKYKTENPNCYLVDKKLTVFEKILRTPDASDDIEWCIKHGANLYAMNEISKKFPIHHAADSLCPGNLQTFLKFTEKAKVNLKFEDRNTLHLLIELLSEKKHEKKFDDIMECVRILLLAGCDPNMEDKKRRTPFYLLMKADKNLDQQKHRQLIEFFLDKSEIDVHNIDRDRSAELIKLLDAQLLPVPEPFDRPINVDYLTSLIECGEQEEFFDCFDEFKDGSGSSEEFSDDCATLLVAATKNNLKSVVDNLVNTHNVDINHVAKSERQPAAFYACSRGYHEILEIFVNHTKSDRTFDLKTNFDKKNLLHEVCSHFGFASDKIEAENYQKCFDLLISCADIDVNQQDEFGFTPLYYAIRYNNDVATKALLRRGYVGGKNIFNKSQFHNIKKETLREFLDECVTVDSNESSREQTVKIDFKFLVAPECGKSRDFFEEIAPLEDIAKNKELRELLLHPVLSSFLYIKWIKLSILFYTNLLFFFFFMGSFITYAVLWKSNFLFWFSMTFLAIMIMKELAQFYLSYTRYFKSCMNWFEISLIILIAIVLLDEQYQTFHDTLGPKSMKIIRGVTILCAACEFLFLFGDLPNFSVSTHMVILRRVFMTFLKAIGLYAILIIGFAFCFYALFSVNDASTKLSQSNGTSDDAEDFHNFRNPGMAILKTIVMFSGELEASNIKLTDNDASYSVIFIMFVFLISIVLLNLINGLSVNDVFQIKAEGLLIDLCQKIHVLNKYENIILGRKTSTRCLKSIVCIFPQFVPDGIIMIDQYNRVKLGSDEFVTQDSFFENFYHRTLKNCIRVIGSIKVYFEIERDQKVSKKSGFHIKMDPKIMERLKNVIDERDEKFQQESKEKRMCLIEEKLQSLAKIDEKLETIMKMLKNKYKC